MYSRYICFNFHYTVLTSATLQKLFGCVCMGSSAEVDTPVNRCTAAVHRTSENLRGIDVQDPHTSSYIHVPRAVYEADLQEA